MKAHPLSEVFPLMDAAELRTLADDVTAHGLREPVVTYEGMILDGRNRWAACKLAKVKQVPTVPYEGDDPVGYVVSANLHRRHLSVSQRALIGAEIAKLPRGRTQIGTSTDLSQPDAARLLGVSTSSVGNAAAVLANGTPEEVAAVKTGEATVKETAKQVRDRKAADEVRAAADADPKRYGDLAKELDGGGDAGKLVRELHKRQKAGTTKAEPVHDAKGQEVPAHLRDKFSTAFLADLVKPFEDFARDVVPKARRHTKNTGPKFKHFRSGEALQLLDEIEEAVKRYFALGLEAKPYALCPDCKDGGNKGCEGCGQAGYLTKPQWAERGRKK